MASRIPVKLTRFVGRQQEVAAGRRLLAETRLLTLIGPGGSGKTRLAMEIAQQLEADFPGALFWVDLASIADDSLVPRVVAATLGVPERPGRSAREALTEFLVDKQLLLVLDNCEHLIATCAHLADTLLQACQQLHLLATSREPLALSGETIYPVPTLSFPAAGELAQLSAHETLSPDVLERLAEYESITLFLDRAAAVVPGYALTDENGRSIAVISRRLDGLPLAVELAAARVNVLTADQIANRLDDRFSLLITNQRGGIIERHQTLRAAIDWSFDLLAPEEQQVLQRLSVFAADCSLTTAETVCAGDGIGREALLPLLTSLVNKSLVLADTLRLGEARYSLLDSIRQYAGEKLKASGEWRRMQDRFLRCFLQLAEETRPKLTGEYQLLWLDWLQHEYDNIRAALGWSLESNQVEEGLRIAIALYEFWTIRDYAEEGLTWLERLLARTDGNIAAIVQANALAYATFIAGFRDNTAAQSAIGAKAAAFAEELGVDDNAALAWVLTAQAVGARATGDYQTEFALYKRVIELQRELGNRVNLGIALSTCSFAAMSLGRNEEAQAMLDEALPLLRELGNPYRIAMVLNFSGDLARCKGEFDRARSAYEESLSLLREIAAVRDMASVLHNLGHTCLHLGDTANAQALFRESMASHQEQGNRPGTIECLLGFAGLAIVHDLPAAGVRLLAAAASLGGEHITFRWAATRMEYEHYIERAREASTENAFSMAQAAGQGLSLQQALAEAEDVAVKAAAVHGRLRELDDLTPREREIAILIAQARTNEQIAKELVVSKRTVEKHIANIRSKLAFTERAQIVRWAIETALVELGE